MPTCYEIEKEEMRKELKEVQEQLYQHTGGKPPPIKLKTAPKKKKEKKLDPDAGIPKLPFVRRSSSIYTFISWNSPEKTYRTTAQVTCLASQRTLFFPVVYGQQSLEFTTTRGNRYKIEVICFDARNNVIAIGKETFIACYDKTELQHLLTFAHVYFDEPDYQRLYCMYTCRPLDEDARLKEFIAKPPPLSDARRESPLHNFNGVKFETRLQANGRNFHYSYENNKRFEIRTLDLLTTLKVNFYFADFNCRIGDPVHHLVLACAKVDTNADRMCGDNFLPIDLTKNKFLRIRYEEREAVGLEMAIIPNSNIDIYFVGENVLHYFGSFHPVKKLEREGYYEEPRLNPYCPACNIYNDGDSEEVTASTLKGYHR